MTVKPAGTFPVLSGDHPPFYPADALCPVCGAPFTNGFAYFNGGALLLSADGQDGIVTDRLRAFLHVGLHGRDPDMRDSSDVVVVSELSGGQFDMNWCSVGCLRAWLLGLLDRVESEAGEAPPQAR